MSRKKRNQFWKEHNKVKKHINAINKYLYDDVFSGRFKLVQVDHRDIQEGAYLCYSPEHYNIDEASDPCWRHSMYLIRFVDTEEPERNVEYWAKWSDHFGLCDLHRDFWDNLGKPNYCDNLGLSTAQSVMNNFIVRSDFWDKWRDFDYAKDHWYSGKQLTEMINVCGDKWRSAEALRNEEPDRFKL